MDFNLEIYFIYLDLSNVKTYLLNRGNLSDRTILGLIKFKLTLNVLASSLIDLNILDFLSLRSKHFIGRS